jgi:hypothetical protein
MTSSGDSDIFIMKYSPLGVLQWSKRIGGSSYDKAYSVAVDSSGNVIVTGYFGGTADFGGGTLTSAGFYDIFLAKYSSSGGYLWSKSFGSTTIDIGYGLTVDSTNNIILVGFFQATVDFGGGLLTSAGTSDIIVAKYSSAGTHLWSESFGSTGDDVAYGVAVDSSDSDNVLVTGYFNGTVDFGSVPLTSNGFADVFLVKIAP